jgi:ubiquinone/menaquinone biosynthesis C-methylase UbiE
LKKSATDVHWNERAVSVENDIEVNIMDIFQRNLEYDAVCRFLEPHMDVLEVGCGNGFSTERFRALARHVDAFDFAENMIERAKQRIGETNNRFFIDNVLSPMHFADAYDAVVCVRVLINLRDLGEQHSALQNLQRVVGPGGLLIVAEGFLEGFKELNRMRMEIGLPDLVPAPINFYATIKETMAAMSPDFSLEHEFHLGTYDYLTRVVYPAVISPEPPRHNTEFSERCAALARAYNPPDFQLFSRMRGFVFRRASSTTAARSASQSTLT